MSFQPSYPANWALLRQQQLDHDGNRCRGCGITSQQLSDLGWHSLQVHHCNEGPPNYAGPYGREIVGVNLITFCPDCHDGITESVRRQRYRLSPSKRVCITVNDEEIASPREPTIKQLLEINVDEERPSQKPESSARRISIILFPE
jgi:hypothetical protein